MPLLSQCLLHLRENEFSGLDGLKNQQAVCACCKRASSTRYIGFLKAQSMPQLHQGHS